MTEDLERRERRYEYAAGLWPYTSVRTHARRGTRGVRAHVRSHRWSIDALAPGDTSWTEVFETTGDAPWPPGDVLWIANEKRRRGEEVVIRRDGREWAVISASPAHAPVRT